LKLSNPKIRFIQNILFLFLKVSGLNSGRGLKMTISAVNSNGRSESATLEGFTLKVAELQLGAKYSLILIEFILAPFLK
jgi:hypothetical protein